MCWQANRLATELRNRKRGNPLAARPTQKSHQGPVDLIAFGVILALLVIGIMTVFSASYTTALHMYGDPLYFIKRQLLWAGIGISAMLVMMRVDYRKLRPWALPALLVALLLLGIVLVVGTEARGGQRWLDLGPVRFQPSELGKVAIINFIAAYVAFIGHKIQRFWLGFAVPIAVVGIVGGLVALEDLGTAVVILGTGALMLFISGTRLIYLGMAGGAGGVGGWLFIQQDPVRMKRITAFVDPWADPQGSGWNIIQSLYAIGSGGIFGLGLTQSRQKFAYLPEQYTDFIFSVLAEELGFVATVSVVALFFVLAWRGVRISLKAPDSYGAMLAIGITAMIVIQAFLNIGVVTGSLPVTGITLPLISFGGSSLSVTLAALGVLLNISKAAEERRGFHR